MNCTELDEIIEDFDNFIENDVVFYAMCASLILVCTALLVWGGHISRTVSLVSGGILGGVGVFMLTGLSNNSVACHIRFILSGVSCLIVSLMTLFLVKTGLFIIGGVGLASITHLVWESLPLGNVTGLFSLFNRPGWYFVAVGSGGIVGAVISQLYRKHFLRLASSMLGACGLTLSLALLFERNDIDIPLFVLVVLTFTLFSCGGVVQHYLDTKKKQGRIPVGVPISR